MDGDRVQQLLESGCQSYAVPGAQLGLVSGTDRLVSCAGRRDLQPGRPVLPSTHFHAGSLAKSLVALLVVDAARRGELELDRPCDEQAPGTWPDTPRQIMAQTTGRPNLLPDEGESIESFVIRAGAARLVHPPGRFSYNNAGWPVLDLLLRHRSGGTFEELADARILQGAGHFGRPEECAAGHSVDHVGRLEANGHEVPAAASAAGSRWWTTADELLDLAELHLQDGQGRFAPDDVTALRRAQSPIPGATVGDGWGLGWAVWERGAHRAFGWAGLTAGHRAFLRCFPAQQAAVVLLANSAGPLFGPPGGSALFDALLPELLELLDVPALPDPAFSAAQRSPAELAGGYGPARLTAAEPDALDLQAPPFGVAEPLRLTRWGGNTFVAEGHPAGGIPLAVDGQLLYVGPFALARTE